MKTARTLKTGLVPGRTYRLRLTPIDGGQRMEVRGAIGPISRTQTWVRVQ